MRRRTRKKAPLFVELKGEVIESRQMGRLPQGASYQEQREGAFYRAAYPDSGGTMKINTEIICRNPACAV